MLETVVQHSRIWACFESKVWRGRSVLFYDGGEHFRLGRERRTNFFSDGALTTPSYVENLKTLKNKMVYLKKQFISNSIFIF